MCTYLLEQLKKLMNMIIYLRYIIELSLLLRILLYDTATPQQIPQLPASCSYQDDINQTTLHLDTHLPRFWPGEGVEIELILSSVSDWTRTKRGNRECRDGN